MLRKLLAEIQNLETDGLFTYSAVIVDNDQEESAREIVEELAETSSIPLQYHVQPLRNIARTRNMAVQNATGDLIAFIDDDEFPSTRWLLNHYGTYRACKADGVLGPVKPFFEVPPPDWILKGKFCERPEYTTGTYLHWSQTRTGNVLLGRHLANGPSPFDPKFAVQGEDVNFFKERMDSGKIFVWCNEAPVYETVPPDRFRMSYFLKRAFLQGNVSIHYQGTMNSIQEKARTCMKSIAATIIYTAMLPFTALAGRHLLMKYLIKDTYHVSRLLGIFGLVTVTTRSI